MLTLGIESTAHTLGIGVVDGKKILSNVMDTYKPVNEGLLPRKAADHHVEVFGRVLEESLESASIGLDEVSLISFAQGPGIGAPLCVGVGMAKYLAARYNKEIIGVNHAYAHLKISELLSGLKNPLVLYVSGGNTQIIIEDERGLHALGETLDIGVGNLFDSFGRTIGLSYAHGSELEKLAKKGSYMELPYSVKGMNLVFSGLLTQAERLYEKGAKKEDLAYSLFETSFAMLCEATERALFLTKRKNLIVCGGVAQNSRLQQMLGIMCKEDKVKFGVAPSEFNRDNGAMIAYAGQLLYKKYGAKPVRYWKAITNYRIEMIEKVMKKGSK